MEMLTMGEYSGEIIQQMIADNVVITNTMYSTKENNPNWHSHENLHICLVFQGGKAETKPCHIFTKKHESSIYLNCIRRLVRFAFQVFFLYIYFLRKYV